MKEQLFEQIRQIFSLIDKHRQDPVALLEDANRLSTVNYNLGDLYIEARQDADALELEHKAKIAESFMAYRNTSGEYSVEEAKQMSFIDHKDLQLKANQKSLEATALYIKRQDLDKKCSIIQSYCSELRVRRQFEQSANK